MLIPKHQTIVKKLAQSAHKHVLNSDTLDLITNAYNLTIQVHRQISVRDLVHNTSSFVIQSDKGRLVLREYAKNINVDSL